MYSNDPTQIRQGFVNYIGALLKSSTHPGKAAPQNVVATLIEEAIKLSQDENKVIDLYIMKPMIKGMIFILNQRIAELQKLPDKKASEPVITEYKNTLNTLEKLLSVI